MTRSKANSVKHAFYLLSCASADTDAIVSWLCSSWSGERSCVTRSGRGTCSTLCALQQKVCANFVPGCMLRQADCTTASHSCTLFSHAHAVHCRIGCCELVLPTASQARLQGREAACPSTTNHRAGATDTCDRQDPLQKAHLRVTGNQRTNGMPVESVD